MARAELLCVIVLFISVSCEKLKFDNYRIYRVWIQNSGHLEILKDLEKNNRDELSFLETPLPSSETVEIVVPPQRLDKLTELFEKYNMKFEIEISNLKCLIDDKQPAVIRSEAKFGWQKYYDLPEIYEWLDELLEKFPDLTNYIFGTSFENRTMRAIKLSHKANNPTIFIESNIHGRDWITAATATFILNELLTSKDPEVIDLAYNFDWVFVPVFNVDGYTYSHQHNRIWRKTRQPHPDLDICVGIDLNRNFDFHHLEMGGSKNPCAPTFSGKKPFSAPESFALSEFLKSFNNLKLYLSFHSYGQMLRFPYGVIGKEPTDNHKDLYQIAQKTKEAIKQRFGTEYSVGTTAEIDKISSGNSHDWAKAKLHVPLTFSFVFRDKGERRFMLPPDQIIPNALETLDGIKAMIREARILKYF